MEDNNHSLEDAIVKIILKENWELLIPFVSMSLSNKKIKNKYLGFVFQIEDYFKGLAEINPAYNVLTDEDELLLRGGPYIDGFRIGWKHHILDKNYLHNKIIDSSNLIEKLDNKLNDN